VSDLPEYKLEGYASAGDVLQLHPDGVLRRKPPTPPPVREDLGTHTCGRRTEDGVPPDGRPGPDTWRERPGELPSCSYCGSMHPNEFMRIAEGGVHELGPTDKSYKVYVDSHRPSKFYFQHLTLEQRHRFIELLNAGTMKIGFPGRFYSRPFFVQYSKPAEGA
jgi:hypothetical protein